MTLLGEPDKVASRRDLTWTPRSDAERLAQQVRAIDAWHRSRQTVAQATERAREARMDQRRKLDVMRATHQAIIERSRKGLAESGRVLATFRAPTFVLAHQQPWWRDKLSEQLDVAGAEVLASLDNGAEAVGITIAEQPDVLVVEDNLLMLTGAAVIKEVRAFAPATVTVAQVRTERQIPEMLEAGAHLTFTRPLPPALVAQELGNLVGLSG